MKCTVRAHAGYSLLEAVVYLGACVVLSWVAASWGAQFVAGLLRVVRVSDTQRAVLVVMTQIARDVATASPESLEPQKRWYVAQNRLYRRVGDVTTVVADGITSCVCVPKISGGLIIGVAYTLTKGNYSMSRYMRVGSGRLLCWCS